MKQAPSLLAQISGQMCWIDWTNFGSCLPTADFRIVGGWSQWAWPSFPCWNVTVVALAAQCTASSSWPTNSRLQWATTARLIASSLAVSYFAPSSMKAFQEPRRCNLITLQICWDSFLRKVFQSQVSASGEIHLILAHVQEANGHMGRHLTVTAIQSILTSLLTRLNVKLTSAITMKTKPFK